MPLLLPPPLFWMVIKIEHSEPHPNLYFDAGTDDTQLALVV